MSVANITNSPSALYRSRRAAGRDHDHAVTEVQHAYGRRDLGHQLDRARAEYEKPRPPVVELIEEALPSDPLDVGESEIRNRVAELQAERQRLAFDALNDPAKRQDLADCEAALAGADAELQHVGLARKEAGRREQAAHDLADQRAVEAALDRARELEGEALRAKAKVDKCLATFAEALADHYRICVEQVSALSAAGRPGAMPSPTAIQATVAQALRAAGAPLGWLG